MAKPTLLERGLLSAVRPLTGSTFAIFQTVDQAVHPMEPRTRLLGVVGEETACVLGDGKTASITHLRRSENRDVRSLVSGDTKSLVIGFRTELSPEIGQGVVELMRFAEMVKWLDVYNTPLPLVVANFVSGSYEASAMITPGTKLISVTASDGGSRSRIFVDDNSSRFAVKNSKGSSHLTALMMGLGEVGLQVKDLESGSGKENRGLLHVAGQRSVFLEWTNDLGFTDLRQAKTHKRETDVLVFLTSASKLADLLHDNANS